MITTISPPGAEDLRTYLFRLAEQLNLALASLDGASPAVQTAQNTPGASGDPAAAQSAAPATAAETYAALRSLIANTAGTVRSELVRTESGLRADYTALSDRFGALSESITDTVTATAGAVVRSLGYDAAIDTLSNRQAGFDEYRVSTEGYIRQGFIDYDEQGLPIVGIAIGKGLTSTTVTVDGVEYTHFDNNQSCAFYTADRVSFRLNGREAAYISNSRFCMAEGAVSGALTVGSWRLDPSRGLAVKWI